MEASCVFPEKDLIRFDENVFYKVIDRLAFVPPHPAPFLKRFLRVFLFVAIIFHALPMLLAWIQGVALTGQNLRFCFLRDLTEYGFSFAVIILLLSQNTFSEIQNRAIAELVKGGIFPKKSADEIIKKAEKINDFRGRPLTQSIIFLAAFISSYALFHSLLNDGIISWHSLPDSASEFRISSFWRETPTLSGVYVCLFIWPSSLYLIFNWVVNGFTWLHLVYWISRDELKIDPFHPDRCGGLYPFKYSVIAWNGLIIAVGVLISLDTLNYIRIHEGATIGRWDIMLKLIGFVTGALIIFLGPMSCFTWKLFNARRDGEHLSARLGEAYLVHLKEKLATPWSFDRNSLSKDIGDLTTLVQHYQNVSSMRLWPLDLRTASQMVGTVAGPLTILLIPGILEYLKDLGILIQ